MRTRSRAQSTRPYASSAEPMLCAFPPSSSGEEDRALIRRALDGDPSAAKILVRRLMPVVHARVGWFLWKGAKRPSARDHEDLTQEIWLALMKNDGHRLRAFDPEKGASLEGF